MPDNNRVRRRTVLKTAGLGASAAIIPTRVGAKPLGVHGIAYDTLTHQQAPEAHGQIRVKESRLSGAINIAGYHIPLNKLRKRQKPGPDSFVAKLTEERYIRKDTPLIIKITDFGNHFSGLLKRPSAEFGDLGFRLRQKGTFDIQKSKENHTPMGNWHESNHTFRVPNKGLPTDSGSDRLIKLATGPSDSDNGDGKI